jgi:hypothetical protein
MTTNPTTTTNPKISDALRVRALRWLLKVTKTNALPLPKRIEFGTIECCGDTLRFLRLQLDNDASLDGWAEAINADDLDEFEVTGKTHQFTSVSASTTWRLNGPRLDWHHIEVVTYRGYRPIADHPAVTA